MKTTSFSLLHPLNVEGLN